MTTYRAESDDLTAVADAIRTKAGTTDKLSWPTGYVSAVQGITAGSDKPNVTTTGDFHRPAEWPDYDSMIIPDGDCVYITADNSRHISAEPYCIHFNVNQLCHLECGTVKNGKWTVIKDLGDTVKAYQKDIVHFFEEDAPEYNYFAYKLTPVSGTLTSIQLLNAPTTNFQQFKLKEYLIKSTNGLQIGPSWSYAGMGNKFVVKVTALGVLKDVELGFLPSVEKIDISKATIKSTKITFNGCSSLTSLAFPSTADFSTVTNMAFNGCSSLTSIDWPTGTDLSNVTNTSLMFEGCSSLTKIRLPKIKKISDRTFQNCAKLESITFEVDTVPVLDNAGAFNRTNNCKLYFPSALVDAAKAATNWSTYADRIEAIPTA